MKWIYEITADKGVNILLDGKLYSSRHVPADGDLKLNALKSVQFLYDFGNNMILSDSWSLEDSIDVAKMIQRAVAELIM